MVKNSNNTIDSFLIAKINNSELPGIQKFPIHDERVQIAGGQKEHRILIEQLWS